MEEVQQACIKQEGASQDDVNFLKQMELPDSQARKCFYACVLEKMGASDGKRFDKKGFLSYGESVTNSDEKIMKNVRAMAESCGGTENEDRCELAFEIMACFRNGQE